MKIELSRDYPFEDGIVIPIDKPYDCTSTDVVRRLKSALRRAGYPKIKIGHAGTLDPLATGVLLVCVGKATKSVDSLHAQPKEYIAQIAVGATTPSYDLEHPVNETYPWEHITREKVEEALRAMIGDQMQVPPAYSAKMIDGRRAYEYAREGTQVEMRLAPVTIYNAELLECDLPQITVRISCSKGTYIRSIARDLGIALGSGGHLTALRRTASGSFIAEECFSPDEVVDILESV